MANVITAFKGTDFCIFYLKKEKLFVKEDGQTMDG